LTWSFYSDKLNNCAKFLPTNKLPLSTGVFYFMQAKKQYEAPKVITYSEDEIIEMLGPAQTCSPSPCPTYQ